MSPSGEPQFAGRIGRTVEDSEPWWPDAPTAGLPDRDPGAQRRGRPARRHRLRPLRLLRLDASTRRTSTASPPAGCATRTSTSPPLCSPTRAALLTGRNHHAVGMRAISNFDTGFPHHARRTSRNHAATVAEVLRDARATPPSPSASGTWRRWSECSAAGPVRPVAAAAGLRPLLRLPRGRDRPVPPRARLRQPPDRPAGRARGRLPPVSEDLVDQAIGMVADSKVVRPDRPFFLYLAFGATHAPHQAPPSYLDKYRGRFDEGWDVVRERVVRAPARARRRPAGHRAGAAQPGRRAVGRPAREPAAASRARLQEAFAAFLDHTDDQIGRLVDGLERDRPARQHDASSCSPTTAPARRAARSACMHEMKFFNGILETPDEAVEPHRRHRRPAQPHQLPVGLGAGRQHAVQVVQAEHPRGRRPRAADRALAGRHRRPAAAMRHQFCHVDRHRADHLRARSASTPPDDVPRARPAAGAPARSLRLHVRRRRRRRPARRVQYFERCGHRGIWQDGWKAVT